MRAPCVKASLKIRSSSKACACVREAASTGLDCEEVIYTEKFAEDTRAVAVLDALKQLGPRFNVVSEQVFAALSDTKTPQGIVLLARRFATDRATFEGLKSENPLM